MEEKAEQLMSEDVIVTKDLSKTYGKGKLEVHALRKTNIEIGELLSINTRTMETHRAHILEKLNLKGSADIVRYAIEKGIG